MAIDLNSMSQKELLDLKKDVEKALVAAEDRSRREALAAAKKAANDFGFSLDELISPGDTGKKRSKNPAKYRNPENPAQTWSGLGRKPQWIHDALEKGTDLKKLEIR